jgi:hypothetical protein
MRAAPTQQINQLEELAVAIGGAIHLAHSARTEQAVVALG